METIMKMDNDNLYLTRYDDRVVEMEEKEDLIHRERNLQAMENEVGIRMEDGDSRDWEERENGAEKIKEDLPSVDDVCPICFDGFTIPCRSNCGHWFCASCILQFWRFKSSINPCKCPLCCRQIVKLEPQAVPQTIPQADDSIELLKKVRQYNGLYITGLLGAVHRVQAFPLLLGRIFRVLLEPDSLKCIHFITRLLGWCLALLYERGEFEFMPSGGLGIQRMFNLCGSVVVVVLFSIGAVYRWMLRRRVRRLGQAWDA